MSDAAPWEDYQQNQRGPWDDYANPANAPTAAPRGGITGAIAGASRALEANFPFADRAVAGAKTYLPQGYGGTGEDYASNLSKEQLKNEQFSEQNPWTSGLGGVVSSAPLVAAGGSPLAMTLGSGAWGLLGGASSSPDLTNTADTGRRAAMGELTGGALGAAAPLVGKAVGAAINPLAAALRKGPGAAEVAGLGNEVKAAYQNVKDIGASYSPEAYQGLTDKIAADAADADIDPGLNPKATNIIKNLQARSAAKVESGQAVTLSELDKARQFVNDNLSGLPEPKQARFGAIIKGNIDDFIDKAGPQAMAAKEPATAPNFNPPIGADANYVPPGSATPETITGATISAKGRAFDAENHILAMDKAEEALGRDALLGASPADGFRTSTGRIVDRDEATRLSGASGPPGMRAEARNILPPRPTGPAPITLHDFIRGGGGVQDEGGDLRSAGLGSVKGLINPQGRPMDEARRAAAEAGYLGYNTDEAAANSTVPDFIDRVVDHPAYSIHDDEAVASREAYKRAVAARDQARDENMPSQVFPPDQPQAPAVAPEVVPPAPTAADAAGALRNARDLAMRQFKAKALANALSKAEINADVAGTGGNIENATRRRLASILDKEPWSPDETDQINRMIHGTPVTNTLRHLGRFGPKGNALMAALELGSGSPGAISAAIGGTAAQAGEGLARRAGQGKLLATILAGGKSPVMPSYSAGPTRAALAAALAANQQLPHNRGTPQSP